MKRHIALLTAGLGLSATALLTAPAAHATDITNPADNPAPITVTVGGQSYTDGQDTLPGYDDYACTIIPGVDYDYADNEIIYHTDTGTKTVHWTEWDRIAGYQVWLKQQSGSSTGGSGSTTSSGTSSSTSTSTSSSTRSTSSTTKKKTTKPSASAKPSTSASPGADVSATASASESASTSASASESASPSESASARPRHHKHAVAAVAPSPSPSEETATTVASDQQLASASTAAGHGTGNTRLAGALILAAFAAGSIALLLGNAVRTAIGRRSRRGGVA